MKRREFVLSGLLASASSTVYAWPSFFSSEETADIAIVGAGGAGLAAALRASELIKGKIIVLEKNKHVGGSTLISGGYLGVVDPARQLPYGIYDSEEQHFQDISSNADNTGDPELIRHLVSKSKEMLEWLENAGMRFRPELIEIYGSHFPRCHVPEEPNGYGYISTLVNKSIQNNVEVRTGSPVMSLNTDKSGAVVGLTYLKDGKLQKINTNKGVILASGGFGANPAMVAKFNSRLAGLTCNCAPGATGEMLLQAEKCGAVLKDMDYIQCLPGVPSNGKIRVRFHNDISRFILVNSDGRRFVKEDSRRDVLRDAVLAQPGRSCFVIVDSEGFESYDLLMRRDAVRGIETGDAFKGSTLKELAGKLGVPSENLINSVEEYNRLCSNTLLANQHHPIVKAPFWAAKSSMSIHYTMGGISINSFAECLNGRRKAIAGLLAAGECTGGVHGKNRIGANGICDALTFGMTAAETLISK